MTQLLFRRLMWSFWWAGMRIRSTEQMMTMRSQLERVTLAKKSVSSTASTRAWEGYRVNAQDIIKAAYDRLMDEHDGDPRSPLMRDLSRLIQAADDIPTGEI